MNTECIECIEKTQKQLANKFCKTPDEKLAFKEGFTKTVKLFEQSSMPQLAREIHFYSRSFFSTNDLYFKEKQQANQILLKLENQWRKMITDSDSPFDFAAKLSVIGNVIDYGAHSVNGNILEQIENLIPQPLAINHLSTLKKAIPRAKKILYLGDNAGEIVFDKLFIEQINHPNIIFAHRGEAVINDVTKTDTIETGINKAATCISNGYDAPGTILERCSLEFQEAFLTSDLIISKGQGNFESLMNRPHPNLYFLLMAKCHTMAKRLGVKKGQLVITKQKDHANS